MVTFPSRTKYKNGFVDRMLLQDRKQAFVEDTSKDPVVGAPWLGDGINETRKFARTVFLSKLEGDVLGPTQGNKK